MTTPHIWLRAETKPLEERIALTPNVAKQLLDAGFKVTVEESEQSAFASEQFARVGCDIKPAHSWRQSPPETIVLGLKELDDASWPLVHNHIHFAHVYKGQQGWQEFLNRFTRGKGQLFDLEFLLDENNRRIAAFGYWAGFIGAAVALKAFAQRLNNPSSMLQTLSSYPSQQAFVDQVKSSLGTKGSTVKMLVIGAKGRCGQGAVKMAEMAGIEVTQWDLEETKRGGPFPEILSFDILVNCVFVQAPIKPFVTTDILSHIDRKLSIICDVSCETYGGYNPLPIYDKCTTFAAPTLRLIDSENPLDLIAIDHLPSLLPVESSEDFSQQLLPYLLQLGNLEQGVWRRANQIFIDKVKLAINSQ